MATAELERIEIPTGLGAHEVRALKRSEKETLAAWHTTMAGDNNGREWLPAAVRLLDPAGRLALAEDEELEAQWIERERRRVRDVRYFTPNYGHVKDDEGGEPEPFTLWLEQEEVLELMIEELRLVILKARQLGLTWLALHYGYHLLALEPSTPNATVLGLSQDGGYAKILLERTEQINQLLPPWLRGYQDQRTRESKTLFKLVGRGRMVSLPGTPSAPRTYQADLAIGDEWAFVRNGQAGPTTTALLPAARKIFLISSGNGPPEEEGWGQSFAQRWTKADEGSSEFTAVFLPTSVHPDRTEAWREAEIENYDTEEEFYQEHPEEPDEALIGSGKDRYFKLAEINAAVELGAELDQLLGTDEMPPPAGELIYVGLDHGEASVGLPIWPLEGGGVYVPPLETVHHGSEPGQFAVALHEALLESLQDVDRRTGALWPPIGELRYDAAGSQSQKTITAVARDRFTAQYEHGQVRTRKVPFGKYKGETAKYLRRLFRRVGQGRTVGVIAISPANEDLIRQTRGLESGPGEAWKKADDQHGPDALVAGVQRIARVHRAMIDRED